MESYASPINFQPQPSDVLIAVMGITGSGKSTFISHCTDHNVSIGEGLRSHTQDIVAYPCKADIGVNVYLIDTPGFDDAERDDAQILKQIATWVGDTYQQKIYLRGILYLHRITDIRMQGAAVKNLFMFKKLCGAKALQNVILVTSMWDEIRDDIGERREKELQAKPEYWARKIIRDLVGKTTKTILAIQEEMVDEKRDLHDTSAGKELDGILTIERERFARDIEQLKKDMAEARELQDKESQEQIRLLQQQRQAEIAKLLKQQESMKVSLEQLHDERFAKLEQLITTQKSQIESDRLKIADMTEQLSKSSLAAEPKSTHVMKDSDATTYSCGNSFSHIRTLSTPGISALGTVSELFIVELALAVWPDGLRIAVLISDPLSPCNWVEIWDSSTTKTLQTSRCHYSDCRYKRFYAVAYSPDGLRIASASTDGAIHVWDSNTARCLQAFVGHAGAIVCLAYSPDGRCIASGSYDRTVKIFNSSTTQSLQVLVGHGHSVASIVYSPCGHCIASGSYDTTVKIWDVRTGRCLQTLRGHGSVIGGLAYSPDGRRIASASDDKTIKIWDVNTGRCLQTLGGNSGSIRCVAYSRDGCHMISTSADGIVKIWQTNTSN